jgi:cytochrome c nitrite reductase small subunit
MDPGRRGSVQVAVVAALAAGLVGGLGLFTFQYAEGLSYFSTDPKACTNCHIMRSQFDSWQKGSHHAAAKCVDCHLPHGFFGKWLAKGENGYFHSKAFTLQDFHEPIAIKPRNGRILQENCVGCHADMVSALVHGSTTDQDGALRHCHHDVGRRTQLGETDHGTEGYGEEALADALAVALVAGWLLRESPRCWWHHPAEDRARQQYLKFVEVDENTVDPGSGGRTGRGSTTAT